MPLLTLSQIAELCGAELRGDGSPLIRGAESLAEAGPDEISFFDDPRYAPELARTRAAGVLVSHGIADPPPGITLLACADPRRALSRFIAATMPAPERPAVGLHPSAVVEPGAEVDPSARVGAFVFIGRDARVAAGAILHPGVVVGAGATVGQDSELFPRAVLYPRVRVGARCIVHAGAVLGSDGFGFEPTAAGWERTPQGGTVVLEDDVEVGANSAIDCARFGATRLGAGTKVDNLVHIAHNVRTGKACMLLAQAGIAGSTRLGRRVIVAGQAGVAGHLALGDGARVGGAAAVFSDVEPGQDVFGNPAGPKVETLRALATLPRLAHRMRDLHKRIQDLEQRAR